MESCKQKHIPLGCRFIPHDQWFLTHIEPSWKIKHIKQMILAKSFGLPFDPRKFSRETSGGRPHSPITFAPDDSARPISPIQFASAQEVRKKRSMGGPEDGDETASKNSYLASGNNAAEDEEHGIPGDEGYEEDDEWDDDEEVPSPHVPFDKPMGGGRVDVGGKVGIPIPISTPSPVSEKPSRKFNPLSKLTGSSNTGSSSNQTSHTSSSNIKSAVPQGSDFAHAPSQDPKKEPEIQTHDYTLIRFSTGQVLEEDFVASWYDLLPNELVELHSSSTPPSFEIARRMPRLLLDPSYHLGSANQRTGSDSTFPCYGITVTSLPRHDPIAYAQPYWEGWARALRTVYTPELPLGMLGGGKSHTSFQDYGAGMLNYHNSLAGGLALFMIDPGIFPDKHQMSVDPNSMTKSMEWRDRWVVIRDGTLNLCKSRFDRTPTHSIPLSTMVSLKDASHLINHANLRAKAYGGTRQRSRTLRSGESERDHRSHHRRSISQPRSTTSTVKDYRHREQDDGRHSKTQVGSSRGSGSVADASKRGEKSSSSKHHSGYHTATAHGGERTRTYRRLEDELERQIQVAKAKDLARRRERELRQKQEQELEYLRNWDSVSFKKKPKDKDKDKADKGKGRDLDSSFAGDSWRERDYGRSTRGYGDDDRDLYKDRASKDGSRQGRDNCVPRSKEEAEASGMRIICCQFRKHKATGHERDRHKKPAPAPAAVPPPPPPPPHGLRYTSTGPSLAGDATKDSDATEKDRDRKDLNASKTAIGDNSTSHQHTSSQNASLLQNVAPRKASLPIIHLSSNKPSSSSPAVSSSATGSNAIYSTGGGTSAKFGIGGFFGKDREMPSDDTNNAKREKEERKREEKERKAREKEQKVLEKKAKEKEKEKEKAKRKEEPADEEELVSGSALGWTLGKKRSGKIKDENLLDSGPFSDSAIPSGSATLHGNRGRLAGGQPPPSIDTTMESTKPSVSNVVGDNEENGQTSASIVQNEKPSASAKPKLTLSEIPDPVTRTRSGSDSSSCSLSSPVFHHSTESDESLEDFNNENGPLANMRRAERKGYRYGGFHDRKRQNERKPKIDATHGQRPSVIEVFNTPTQEPPKSEALKPSETGKESSKADNHSTQSSRKPPASQDHAEGKERKEDHADWVVLDMGTDFAFNSILRVFHRSLSDPFASDFVPAGLAASTSQFFPSSQDSAPLDTHSSFNSPMQSHLSSSTTLARGSDHLSLVSEQSRQGSSNLASSSTLRLDHDTTHRPDHVGVDRDPSTSTRFSQDKPQHPASLQLFSKLSKNPPLIPALPYPEWRRELVLRARRYGMRDHRRPLDLALHGWSVDFEEMDFADMASRLPSEEDRRNEEYFGSDLYGSIYEGDSDDPGTDEDGDWSDEDDENSDEEEEEITVAKLRGDEGRRMSQVSHVSTLKAAEINAAAAAAMKSSSQSVVESFDENDEGAKKTGEEVLWEDTESVVGYKDDGYEPGSGDTRDDDDDEDALGIDSILDDSDEDEASESEWVAWITDLPRQIEVRRIEKELEKTRRAEEEEQKHQEALRKQGYGPGEKPLSPMIFSNPFIEQQQAPPLDVEYLDLEPTSTSPQSHEEQRRQYVASRRRLEPTTAMTTSNPSPPSPVKPSHKSITSIASMLGTGRRGQSQQTRLKNSTLSSQSSSESLGYLTQPSQHLSPFPLPHARSNIADDRDQDTGSSSTTPASPSFANTQHPSPSHHHPHSRSISGSQTGHPRLHHSLSMPLGPGSGSSNIRAHGSSVPASVPHSPVTPFTPNKAILKKPPPPMNILTKTQINEIETETNQRIQQQYPTGGFYPAPTSSSSSSFVPPSIPIPMPRRSSSAGNSVSPPPSAVGPTNISTSLGSAGPTGAPASLGRSSSLLLRPHHPPGGITNERGERERGVLKKRPSDLGKGKERETDASPGLMKQRPKLSLSTMGGVSSNSPSSSIFPGTSSQYNISQPEVQSPTTSSGKIASAKAFLRRVRSGSSLRLDSHLEEDDDDYPHSPRSPTITTHDGREVSPPTRKKISTMDRFVRGLDSALEFVEGR